MVDREKKTEKNSMEIPVMSVSGSWVEIFTVQICAQGLSEKNPITWTMAIVFVMIPGEAW